MRSNVMFLPATRAHVVWAGVIMATMVAGFIGVWEHIAMPLRALPAFLPIFSTAIVGTEGMTALLLFVQCVIFGQLFLGVLSGAYAFVALSAAIQLLVFPGVFSPQGLLGAGAQSAVWIWVFWHAGFAFFVLIAVSLKHCLDIKIDSQTSRIGAVALAFGLPTATSALLCYLAISSGGQHLPLLVLGNSYGLLLHSPYALAVVLVNLAALLTVSIASRWKTALDLWVFVALIAALLDVTLTLSASARYTLGWYAARCLSLVSSTSVLSMLIWEINRLYRNLDLAHQELKEHSARDGLTAVYNRGYFDERYEAQFQDARRNGLPLSLLLIDVDFFKSYNDHFGHQEGDHCLISIAAVLDARAARYGGFVARYGGEEFVVILSNAGRDVARIAAEDMKHAIASLGIPAAPALQEKPAIMASDVVTVSIGVATCVPKAIDRRTLFQQADQALYAAKKSGRNRVHIVELP